MKDKHINSLQGCLMDYAYANETDWNTFNELVKKATAYDTKEVQDAIECDRIERNLYKNFESKEVCIYCECGIFNVAIPSNMKIPNYYDKQLKKYFEGKTKLEALTKALEWVEGENK